MKQINSRIIITSLVFVSALFLSNLALAQTVPNLIGNPSVEQVNKINQILPVFFSMPTGWNKHNNIKNVTFFYYPVAGYNSAKAIKTQVTYYKTDEEGWYFNSVSIDPAKQYIYSDNYISNVASYISATFKLSNGTSVNTELAQLNSSSQ